jgi:glycosyltransferase involved in cell wall biosynthesis
MKDHKKRVSLRILLVSTADTAGGAERTAWNLYNAYSVEGHKSWLAVGRKKSDDPNVVLIPNESSASRWATFWDKINKRLQSRADRVRGFYRLSSITSLVGNPIRWMDMRRGYENFHFPGTWRLFDMVERPEIIHCFNLHGYYFDLRALGWMSSRYPVILDLRDAWLLSGHCAHSFGCDRWKIGCGNCPDITSYPAISRDGTAINWRKKRDLYAASKVYVATPSRWLMRKVEQSILARAIVEARVIATGVDLATYHPADQASARRFLDLPQHAKILLFAANNVRRNVFKDYDTLESAIALLANRPAARNIHLVALGENSPDRKIGAIQVHFVPHQNSAETVARYYQAADIYVHAAREDTFPRAVLEAMACGTPVVATAVGGIPEQINGLKLPALEAEGGRENRYGLEDATGILTTQGKAVEIASAIEHLLANPAIRIRLGKNAAKDAARRFDLQRQTRDYLEWYEEILESFQVPNRVSADGRKRNRKSSYQRCNDS